MEEAAKVDGRRARGRRTHDAIVAALMQLVGEGDLSPTAQRVAERAGVSVRSVYQHFSDVEGLFQATSVRTYESVTALMIEIDPAWPIERRVDAFVAERGAVLEAMTPFSRALRLIEPSSPALRRNRVAAELRAREELSRVFEPELASLTEADGTDILSALDLVTTWSSWDHLRQSGLSPRSARRVMRTGVWAVLSTVCQKAS